MQIIDNQSIKLVDVVNSILPSAQFSKMAVGFFYLSGFEHIRPNLANVQHLRLLIGNSTNQQTADELLAGYSRLDIAARHTEQLSFLNRDQVRDIVDATSAAMREQLEGMPQDDATEEGIKTLQQLIAEKRVEVKVYTRGVLHSKAYLFEYPTGTPMSSIYKGIAIVGSSNLSHGGLASNSELNVQLKEKEDFEKVDAWFDALWDQSEPFDAALLNVVQGSWTGRTLTPYELYLKTLYELIKDRLEDDQPISALDELNLPSLIDFQWDAFNQARRILDQYGGVFVADVVGFGKSYIGSALIKYYRDFKRKRTLIICPARLVPMWKQYNALFDLGAEVYSMGRLTYPDGTPRGQYSLNDMEALEMYDMVLIDESHNFRNNETDRYQILQPYLKGRQVILLTATPQNKSVWDYYYQIKLFHQQERSLFPLPVARLDAFFRLCEQKPALLSQLLQYILIRRRRKDIAEAYRPVLNGTPVTFPKRRLHTLSYEIERTYHAGVYSEVTDVLANKLQYARYGLANYLRASLTKSERRNYEGLSRAGLQLRGLIKMLLLKRMESSAQALVNTINNMLAAYRVFRRALDSGAVLVGRTMDQVLRGVNLDLNEDFDEDALVDLWTALGDEYRYNLRDFDAARLLADTAADIDALEDLKKRIEPIVKTNVDDKRDQLIRTLRGMGERKVLIFTEFQDTAAYLDRELRQAFPDREIARASGGDNTLELVRRFAPKANTRSGLLRSGETEIDILIATDVLSEGQNLQDAATVINYDIHWNPVRLIQRIGRVDRIGSEAAAIEVYNFLPERELEKQLNLQSRVQRRVQEIHDVLGEDDKILTEQEVLNEASLYRIARGDESVLDENGPQDPLTPLQEAERVIRELERTDPQLFARIKGLPGGLRGALPQSAPGSATFAFCRAGDYRRLYLQTPSALTTDEMDILNALRCAPDTPGQMLPHHHNTSVMKLFADFESEVEIISSDLDNQRILTRSQKYVDQALRDYFSGVTDLKERRVVEDLRAAFTGDLEQYIIAALNRLQRDRLTGAALVEALSAVYSAFDMGAERTEASRARARERRRRARLAVSGSSL